MAMVVVDDSCL